MAAVARPSVTPSFNRVEPGSQPLNLARFPPANKSKPNDPSSIAKTWANAFNNSLESPESLSKLFLEESYWRDHLCLSWEFHTLNGPSTIESFLKKASKDCRIKSIEVDDSTPFKAPKYSPVDSKGEVDGVSNFITIKTDVGEGVGTVSLAQEGGVWKAFTLFTTLRSLTGHEELSGPKRPTGVDQYANNVSCTRHV